MAERIRARGRALSAALALGAAVFLAGQIFWGGTPGLAAVAKKNEFVGADKCKNCHSDAAKGDPYGVWSKSKHAQAYAVLAGDEAKKVGKEKGVAEPQKSADCSVCHVTASA